MARSWSAAPRARDGGATPRAASESISLAFTSQLSSHRRVFTLSYLLRRTSSSVPEFPGARQADLQRASPADLMLTAQLTEIRRDLAQFPSAASLQRACTAVDDARLRRGRPRRGRGGGGGFAPRCDRHSVIAQPPPCARQLPRVFHALRRRRQTRRLRLGWGLGRLGRPLELECIAPGNSTRRDHRQDQAALTVLAWKHHLHSTCTRQIVPLIVHVEGVRVPCAGSV